MNVISETTPTHMLSPSSCSPTLPPQVLPILEILYHVEDRNSHHVYMALIILLILTEDDAFNRSIHEVVGRHILNTHCSHLRYCLGSLRLLAMAGVIEKHS